MEEAKPLFTKDQWSQRTDSIYKRMKSAESEYKRQFHLMQDYEKDLIVSLGKDYPSILSQIRTDNTFQANIASITKTTKLLDQILEVEQPFILFKRCFRDETFKTINLIATKYPRLMDQSFPIGHHSLKPTISELKTCSKRLYHYTRCDIERMQDICKEIEISINDKQSFKIRDHDFYGDVFRFQYPCLLGGQCSSDRYGFGTSYYFNSIESQQLYGDMSVTLFIIGFHLY